MFPVSSVKPYTCLFDVGFDYDDASFMRCGVSFNVNNNNNNILLPNPIKWVPLRAGYGGLIYAILPLLYTLLVIIKRLFLIDP